MTVRSLLLPLLVFIGSFVLYIPSLSGDFVWDDPTYVRDNPFLQEPGALWDVLTLRVLTRSGVDDNVRPVYLASVLIDKKIWGDRPFGYHLTNNLLHALNAVLVFLVASRLSSFSPLPNPPPQGGRESASWRYAPLLGALVFAVHPLNTEAVCPITFREDLLATFFLLLGLVFVANRALRPGPLTLTLSLRERDTFLVPLCLLLSVMSKESGSIGPFVLAGMLALSLLGRGEGEGSRFWSRLFSVSLRFPVAASFLAVGLFLLARFILPPTPEYILGKPEFLGGSFMKMLAIQPRIWAFQLKTIFLPRSVSADPILPAIEFLSLGLCLFVLVIVIVIVIGLCRRSRLVLFGVTFASLAILPVSNFVPLFVPVADRFLYMPLAGVALALAGIMGPERKPLAPFWKVSLLMAFGLWMGSLCGINLKRQEAWHDNVSLWTRTLEQNPRSFIAANNLGFALWGQGRFEDSLVPWQKAVQLSRGRVADPLAGLAIGLKALGRGTEASLAYERAKGLDPRYGDPDRLVSLLLWEKDQARALKLVPLPVK